MSSKTIRFILTLMLLTVAALFGTQGYWFKKAFILQERQFDEKLNIALRDVADKLLILDEDVTTRIPPITQLSSNEFYVNTNCYFSLATLDGIIRSEFKSRNINIDFDYVILKAETLDVALGNTVIDLSDTSEVACKLRKDDRENRDFKIRLNDKTAHLMSSMGIWVFSSFSLLLILAVFTFIIVSILKGKKLSLLKKDFVNNMTHEFKTPIANISVASDAIRNVQMDDTKLKKYANIIYDENVRLHNLVDRILQISSIEKKEQSLDMKPIDLHQLISDVALSFEPLIHERKGRLQSKLNATNFTVQGDSMHLSNAVNNVIENAIKYSQNQPDVTIETSNNKEGVTISIRDHGIGMSSENQSRIFEKFFRAQSGNIHNTKGHGLGLSYVKSIMAAHGGSVTFTSKVNVGSTFNLFFPL